MARLHRHCNLDRSALCIINWAGISAKAGVEVCFMSRGRLNNGPPKDVYVLFPRTCDYVTLHG